MTKATNQMTYTQEWKLFGALRTMAVAKGFSLERERTGYKLSHGEASVWCQDLPSVASLLAGCS